jgi:hypothetical protein
MSENSRDAVTDLFDASKGFDRLFDDDVEKAREAFSSGDSPFHLLGIGALSFLEAALSFEVHAI